MDARVLIVKNERHRRETRLPEGHTIHRAAKDHHKKLSGQTLQVSSPQGRFSEGSEILSGKVCHSVEALGKHLLYRFESSDVLHVHLGLFGKIRSGRLPLKEPIGAVRVRLVGDTHCIDINGPAICEVMGPLETKVLFNRIGPDILRSDAEPIRAFARTAKSKLPIGQLLMDQSVIAGIGNIFRSEILWRQGIHPKTPGNAIDETTFNKIWEDARDLLALAVKHNSIITVQDGKPSSGKYRERVNVYKKTLCPKCGGGIQCHNIAGRKAYAYEKCQPLY